MHVENIRLGAGASLSYQDDLQVKKPSIPCMERIHASAGHDFIKIIVLGVTNPVRRQSGLNRLYPGEIFFFVRPARFFRLYVWLDFVVALPDFFAWTFVGVELLEFWRGGYV